MSSSFSSNSNQDSNQRKNPTTVTTRTEPTEIPLRLIPFAEMSSSIPDQIILETKTGVTKLTLDEWKAQGEADMIQAIARKQVSFYRDGKLLEIREALASLAMDAK